MRITVKDCLESDIFKNAKLAAGSRGLDNPVKGVTVCDGPARAESAAARIRPGELVLTGFYGWEEDGPAAGERILRLAAAGAAAAVVFLPGNEEEEAGTGSGLAPASAGTCGIPAAAAEAADRACLPLIAVPGESGLSYSDVITALMARLLYSDHFANRLISNTIFHLLNFEKHSNFQSAVREAAINNDFQLILLSGDFNPILSVETRHKATIADAIRLGRERDVEKSAVYTMIDVDGVLTYWGPVMINNEKYFMFIVDNEDSYSAGEITKLAEIIELAMGMWKYTPERDARSEFIKALRRGNKSLAYTLKEEAGIDGSEILSVFYGKGMERGNGLRQISDFEKEEGLQVMKITEGEDTYGMILSRDAGKGSGGRPGGEGEVTDRSRCIGLFGRIKEDKSVRIFHVTGIDGIESAADAYRLISESWSFVQNVFPYKRVFTKYELTLVSNCINIQLQGGFVKKNYLDLLEPFREARENKGKQLLETLETFVLDAGMNSAKTAEFMGIHTNTVQYRLKKINEVLDVEITANRVIPGLTIALALKRLERVVRK